MSDQNLPEGRKPLTWSDLLSHDSQWKHESDWRQHDERPHLHRSTWEGEAKALRAENERLRDTLRWISEGKFLEGQSPADAVQSIINRSSATLKAGGENEQLRDKILEEAASAIEADCITRNTIYDKSRRDAAKKIRAMKSSK